MNRGSASPSSRVPDFNRSHNPIPALTGYPWLVDLSPDGQHQDVATLPLGAEERRPIVIAVHGAGDRPNWACGGWRIGVESHAFVACPMGLRMSSQTYGWSNRHSIEVAVERTLEALHHEFGSRVSEGPMIYAGFSQGANLARSFLVDNAKRFPAAALAEGGYDYLTDVQFARAYWAAGGRRILILCGTQACLSTAQRAKATLENAGLLVIVTGDPLAGHNLNVRMQISLRREWQRFVDDLPGWETFSLHRWPHITN